MPVRTPKQKLLSWAKKMRTWRAEVDEMDFRELGSMDRELLRETQLCWRDVILDLERIARELND